MKRKMTAILLTLAMLLSLVIPVTGMAESEYTTPVDLTVWYYSFDNTANLMDNPNEIPVVNYLSRKFNINFDFQIPASGSEAESFNMMIGSGDLTDVFCTLYSSQSAEQLYEDGLIRDLTPYIEQYAPNYLSVLAMSENRTRSGYTSDGKILKTGILTDIESFMWGGLVYRRDILETMTEGNAVFPSGGEEPATIEDWDYMLELMKAYFEATGQPDTACLIIPYNGFFTIGDLLTGFDSCGSFYVDENGRVQYGPINDGFYNYLQKMKEWYAKGYIYQDFPSRSSDLFYLPNPALTYSGNAGIWFGLLGQLGDALSVPEYGLNMDVEPIASPLDTADGATGLRANALLAQTLPTNDFVGGNSWCVSADANEEAVIRYCQMLNYLYSEEGSMLISYGLTKKQCAETQDPIYQKLGMDETGAYWFEDGKLVYSPVVDPYSGTAQLNELELRGRFPGLNNYTWQMPNRDALSNYADEVWTSSGYDEALPMGVTLTPEQTEITSRLTTAVNDYINATVPKFILGTEELTPETYAAYVAQVRALGMDTILQCNQDAYDEFMNR